MARNMYVYFPPDNSNVLLKGGGGRNGKSVLHGFTFSNAMPIGATNSLLVAGKRKNQLFTIRKEVDSTSPSLQRSLAAKKTVNCQINMYKDGYPRPSYSLALTGGEMKAIRHGASSGGGRAYEYEDITFLFEEIEVTWNDGGISAQDDWESAS